MDERDTTTPWLLSWITRLEGPICDVGSTGSLYADQIPSHFALDPRKSPNQSKNSVAITCKAEEWEVTPDFLGTVILHRTFEYLGTGAFDLAPEEFILEKAIENLFRAMKIGGHMILTIPVGVHSITGSISGPVRTLAVPTLQSLFTGAQVVDQVFWVHSRAGYVPVEASQAIGRPWQGDHPGALAGLVVRKTVSNTIIPRITTGEVISPRLIQQKAWEVQINKAAYLMQGKPERYEG